jgi:ZipA, C-terminal FtsZ-binding domain
MNSLQAGLIGVSVLVIALFAAWMWWQTWRNNRPPTQRPSAQPTSTPASKPHTAVAVDSVLGEEYDLPRAQRDESRRSEPVMGAEPTIANEAADLPSITVDARLDDQNVTLGNAEVAQTSRASANPIDVDPPETRGTNVSEAASLAPKSAAVPTTLPLDDRLNVYATISARDGQAIDCQDFAPLADRSLAWGRVFRLSAWEFVEDLTSGGAVQSLCLGMPIASRAGPVTDADALAWKREVSAIADEHQLDVSFGGDLGVGERAAELDQFLAAADVICVLYLVRKDSGSWSGTRLRGTLEANGFRLQADGRFVYFEVESESAIFSAVDGFERSFTPERLRTENVSALRLVFEASNVANPVARFDVYRQTLRALARLLESDIKDSTGANIGDEEFALLRADVEAGSKALAEAGIECGTPAAQALFR